MAIAPTPPPSTPLPTPETTPETTSPPLICDPNRLVPELEMQTSDCPNLYSNLDIEYLPVVQDSYTTLQACNPGLSSFTCHCKVVPGYDSAFDFTCVSDCYTCREDNNFDSVCFSMTRTLRMVPGYPGIDVWSEEITVQYEHRCEHHEYHFSMSINDQDTGAGICSLTMDDRACRCNVLAPYTTTKDDQCNLYQANCLKMDCGEDGITDTMDLCTGDYNIGGALSPFEAEFGRLSYWGENHLETPIYTTVCPGEHFPFAA
jgi:hypothetical protein